MRNQPDTGLKRTCEIPASSWLVRGAVAVGGAIHHRGCGADRAPGRRDRAVAAGAARVGGRQGDEAVWCPAPGDDAVERHAGVLRPRGREDVAAVSAALPEPAPGRGDGGGGACRRGATR